MFDSIDFRDNFTLVVMFFKICLFINQHVNTLELKKDKDTDYVLSWKSRQSYTSKVKPLYPAFFHGIELYGYKVGLIFDENPLAVEQHNYATKTVNAYVVYDLDN